MLGLPLEQIIETLGYIGIFSLMIANGVMSVPSSQILYILSGYFVFTGNLVLLSVVFAGALGNTIGNIILYEVVKRKGLHYITKYALFKESDIRKVQIVFKRRGAWFLFVGKLIPALKVFMPIVAGVGRMKYSVYIPIIFASSFIWASFFVGIGYYFGKNTDFFGTYVIVLIFIAIIVLGIFYKYMNSKSILEEVEKDHEVLVDE